MILSVIFLVPSFPIRLPSFQSVFKAMDDIKAQIGRICYPENIRKSAHNVVHLTQQNARASLYGSLTVITIIWALVIAYKHFSSRDAPSRPRTPDLEKPQPLQTDSSKSKFAMEKPGGRKIFCSTSSLRENLLIIFQVWKPSNFKRPPAPPYPNWSVEHTKPLPYRPFRPKYFVTMGLRSMDWDEWIELDSHYMKFHDIKARRIIERGDRCCRTAPEAFDGAVELLEEFCGYLPERYPNLYCKTAVGMDNLLTGETFNIVERPLKEDPMQMAARMVQDDLAIMFEKEDGQYYLLAGAILLAGFWRLEDKWKMPLSEIHTSGEVPQFKEKLEKGMMNFFRRLRPEAPMLRNNYFIQVDENLAWSYSIGDENGAGANWNTAEKNRAVQHHHFRSERQSLRR